MNIRTIPAEIRASKNDNGTMTAEGRAVPYGVEIILWQQGSYEEREVIEPNAFKDSVAKDDQRGLWNHARDIVLGRRSAKTLRVTNSDAGVDFSVDFPNSPEGESKFESIRRGDVREVSFGFDDENLKEEFFKEGDRRIYKRTVQKGKLWEISPVTWAAYDQDTSIKARSKQDISQRIEMIDSRLAEASAGDGGAAALKRDQELRDFQLEILKE